MTIKKLKQYGAIRREIRLLDEKIARLQSQNAIADTVTGSQRHLPYAKQTMVVRGESKAVHGMKLELSARKARLEREEEKIENFISMIDDSIIRQLIGLRYIDGLSWNAAAMKVYGSPCGDGARKRVMRFLDKK